MHCALSPSAQHPGTGLVVGNINLWKFEVREFIKNYAVSEAIWMAISKLLSASQQQKVAGEIVNIVNFFISILNGEIHSRGGGLKVH